MMLFPITRTHSHPLLLIVISMILVLCTSACTHTPKPEGMPLAEMTFAHLAPIAVQASHVQSEVKFSVTSPAIGYFRPPPKVILQRYLDKRFVPVENNDATGTLYITIPEISLQEKTVQSDTKVINPLEIKTTILHMLLKVDLEYRYGQAGFKRTSLQARRTETLRGNMNISQREQAAQNLINDLINDLDPKLIERIEIITSDLPSE